MHISTKILIIFTCIFLLVKSREGISDKLCFKQEGSGFPVLILRKHCYKIFVGFFSSYILTCVEIIKHLIYLSKGESDGFGI